MKIILLSILISIHSLANPIKDKDLEFNSIIVGRTTFEDVMKSHRKVPITKSGDASESIASICYSNGRNRVLKLISSEMGSDSKITGIRLSVTKGNCTVDSSFNFHQDILGLKLGMKYDEIKKLKGNPKKSGEFELKYVYEWTEKIIDKKYDVSVILLLKFIGNELALIDLSKLEVH